MVHLLVQTTVADLPQFIAVFATRGATMRRLHGSRGVRIFRETDTNTETSAEQSGERVALLFSWGSRAAFEGFMNDPAVRETMTSSGVAGRPNITFLECVAELPV